MKLITCQNKDCKMPFPKKTSRQRFCKPSCRDAFHNDQRAKLVAKARALGIMR